MAAPRSRHARRVRGAATVELALSLMLLVPVLLYAIYGGEAFLAATRAQEAEISAGWDMTAYRMHDYITGYRGDPRTDDGDGASATQRQVAAAVPPRVAQEMGGMDSYRRGNTASAERRFVLSEQRLTGLTCEPFNVEGNYPLLTFEGIPHGTRAYLHRGSYMACRARVRFTSPYMPQSMRDGFHAKEDLVHERLRGFTLCGLGRSLRGCDGSGGDGGFLVLTDDWGLEDATESPVANWRDANNWGYANVGNSIYHRAPEPVEDGHGFEGGEGAKQVRFAMDFLLDTKNDYGETSDFKFGFRNPSSQLQSVKQDESGGMDHGHLTPWDDGEGGFPGGNQVERARRHYLGHPDEDYNAAYLE